MERSPLTPPDCNLQDFHRMMLDITRLRGSEFDSTVDDGAWRAGLNLWMSSWHHLPAGALPDDDTALAKAAGLGRDLKSWRKIKAIALRNWEKCSDGLLYHPTVCELALEAWLDKLAQALSSGAGNAKRWGTVFDPSLIEADIDRTVGMLSALNPKSKALNKASRRKQKPSQPDPDGTANPSRRDSRNTDFSSQENRNGKDRKESPNPLSGASESVSFKAAMSAYPEAGRASTKPAEAEAGWRAACEIEGETRMLAAVAAFAASDYAAEGRGRRVPSMQRWLRDGKYGAWLPDAGAAGGWTGPPEVRAAVAAAMGEDRTRGYLDRCGWRDLPDRAVVTASPTIAKALEGEAGPALEELGVAVVLEKERAA